MSEAATPLTDAARLNGDLNTRYELSCRLERDRAELISALRSLICYTEAADSLAATYQTRHLLKRLGEKMPPYPYCSTPDKCAGLSSCPRDPTCTD